MSSRVSSAFFEVEVALEPNAPTIVTDHLMSLQFAIITREGRKSLPDAWNSPGVYVLLSRTTAEAWSVYVGKASDRGLAKRVGEHVREKPDWTVAILMRRETAGWFNASHQSWLERHLYVALKTMPGITVDNGNTPPGDQSVQSATEVTLSKIADQMLNVLAMAGFRQAAPTPQAKAKRTADTQSRPRMEVVAPHASGESALQRRSRKTNAVKVLIDSGAIPSGTALRIVPNTASTADQETVLHWLGQSPERAVAWWTPDSDRGVITWAMDNEGYSPSRLAVKILEIATGKSQELQGTMWLEDTDGNNLAQIAEQYR